MADDGYFTDAEYDLFQAFHAMGPAHMRFFLTMAGVASDRLEGPFRYCELGSGQGFGLAMLAAFHPESTFVGIDYEPRQTERARQFAERSGLTNVTFQPASFEAFALEDGEPFDVIALHGVWSWVGDDARRDILTILRQRLAPGGVFYIGTNTMPGWASLAPVQRLIADLRQDHRYQSIDVLRAELRKLLELEPRYFKAHPKAAVMLRNTLDNPTNYLAHEYFTRNWRPVAIGDLARDLAEADLTYASAGRARDLLDIAYLTRAQRDHLAGIIDPIARLAMKDLFRDESFRQDLWVRGPRRLSEGEQLATLARFTLAPTVPARAQPEPLKLPLQVVEIEWQLPLLGAIEARLHAGPSTIEDLFDDPIVAEAGFAPTMQTILGLLAANRAGLGLPQVNPDAVRAGTDRFNGAVVFADSPHATRSIQLAAPTVGEPILLDPKHILMLRAVARGDDPVRAFISAVETSGGAFEDASGAPVTCPTAKAAIANEVFATFRDSYVPLFDRLGVI